MHLFYNVSFSIYCLSILTKLLMYAELLKIAFWFNLYVTN